MGSRQVVMVYILVGFGFCRADLVRAEGGVTRVWWCWSGDENKRETVEKWGEGNGEREGGREGGACFLVVAGGLVGMVVLPKPKRREEEGTERERQMAGRQGRRRVVVGRGAGGRWEEGEGHDGWLLEKRRKGERKR
ncbi:hypothetical protein HAX54_016822 [Datura stramonium]|uniref:Uncharacterized protein n=1 Tax=Datura stramonium TaxID=4076 RepID=A0ABS8UKC7_DATST|nr:hypothetical protein [Datura stramonium]